MISDEQAKRVYDLMVEVWGDNLPNPEHEPRRAEHYLKLLRYYQPSKLQEALNGTDASTQT